MAEIITKEQYECAKHTVQFYNQHPHIKLYMDDVERESLKKALEIIKQYHEQVAKKIKDSQNER